jgi:hypothetical protein
MGASGKRHDKEYLYEIVQSPSVGKIYTRRHYNFSSQRHRYAPWLKFRKVAHAVLFTIYLRNFNERMRRNREGYVQKFIR